MQGQTNAVEQAHVLCVDDDPIMRSLIHAKIENLVGKFDEAVDGLEAWGLMQANVYDLAFIDLEMPNLDGFNLIRCVRGNEKSRHMPIVVVSSREDTDAIRTALQAGASSYLVKPINWSLFQPMVAQLLRLAGMARQLDALAASSELRSEQHGCSTSKVLMALEGNLIKISELVTRARRAQDSQLMSACLSEISILTEGAIASIKHEDHQARLVAAE